MTTVRPEEAGPEDLGLTTRLPTSATRTSIRTTGGARRSRVILILRSVRIPASSILLPRDVGAGMNAM